MLSLTLACAFLACAQPLPNAPDDGPLLAPVAADIKLTYICGNSFRVRNTSPDTVTVRYDVYGTTETGPVFLAGKPAGATYSENYFTTVRKGTVRLFLGTQLVQTKANGNLPQCTLPADTVRPAYPGETVMPVPALVSPLPGYDSVGIRRNVFHVLFKPTASGADITAFLNSHSATIIGGYAPPLGDGSYVIRFPDPGPGLATVDSFKATLRLDARVARVLEFGVGGRLDVRGRFPNDGGFSRRIDWYHTISTAPIGTNPRLLVNAPLAWGCQNGTVSGSQPLVGVIDLDFGTTLHPDLPTSTQVSLIPSAAAMTPYPDLTTKPEVDAHALSVAGIIGALGNNGIGTVGMLWDAALRLYPIANSGQVVTEVAARYDVIIRSARVQGVRILSVSVSPDGGGLQGRQDLVDLYRLPLEEFLSDSRNILVVAAGNENKMIPIADIRAGTSPDVTAFDRAVAQLLLTHGSQVIVVAGSNRDGDLWYQERDSQGRPIGSTIWVGATDVIAPAAFVQTLAPASRFADGLTIQQGTSFSAPFVAGTAALIVSANPMLSGAEVRDAILNGAADPWTDNLGVGVRPARDFGSAVGQSHLYHLDAYNALRRASKTNGTPLCGNHLWSEGNTLFAERGSGGAEAITTLPGPIGQILPYHGGRKVVLQDLGANEWSTVTLTSMGAWTSPLPWDEDSTGMTGSAVSAIGQTHDRDSLAFLAAGVVWIGRTYNDYARTIGTLPEVVFQSGGGSEVCVKQYKNDGHFDCYDKVMTSFSTHTAWRYDITVLGDRSLLLTRDIMHDQMEVDPVWTDCFTLQPETEATGCRFHSHGVKISNIGTSVWRIDRLAGGGLDSLAEVAAGRELMATTGSEDGGEFAMSSAIRNSTGDYTNCYTQFYTVATSGPAVPAATTRPNASVCFYGWQGGFSGARQQLTSAKPPSSRGFALQARLGRATRH